MIDRIPPRKLGGYSASHSITKAISIPVAPARKTLRRHHRNYSPGLIASAVSTNCMYATTRQVANDATPNAPKVRAQARVGFSEATATPPNDTMAQSSTIEMTHIHARWICLPNLPRARRMTGAEDW